MKLHQNLPVKHRRIGILLAFVVVLSLWSLVLPPVDILEYELKEDKSQIINNDVDSIEWHTLHSHTTDLQSWDLGVFPTQKEKMVEVPKKNVGKIKKMVIQPPVIKDMPITPYQPPVAVTMNFPHVKYLGQVVDNTGLQIFLAIDNSSVMMRPKQVYEQTWQIVVVDDNEVRLQHIPTQQILRISKL
jgi:hypothetical protein